MQVPFGQRMEGKPCGQKPPPLTVYKKISNLTPSNPFPCRLRVPKVIQTYCSNRVVFDSYQTYGSLAQICIPILRELIKSRDHNFSFPSLKTIF